MSVVAVRLTAWIFAAALLLAAAPCNLNPHIARTTSGRSYHRASSLLSASRAIHSREAQVVRTSGKVAAPAKLQLLSPSTRENLHSAVRTHDLFQRPPPYPLS